jgi:hypothetical protein
MFSEGPYPMKDVGKTAESQREQETEGPRIQEAQETCKDMKLE